MICSRYPYVAAEVLCSEIWSIVETCISKADILLLPWWNYVLDLSPRDLVAKSSIASHFVKINAVFLSKKPDEVSCTKKIGIVLTDIIRCWK